MGKSSEAVGRFGIRSIPVHFIFTGMSAVLLWSIFPHVGFSWLAHIALVPMLVIALRSSSSWRLGWTSYIVGVCWWLVMVKWLIPVTGPGYFFLCLFLGLYTPASLLSIRLLDRKLRMPLVLAVPMVWVSFEMIRGYCPMEGFGWFAISHSQAPSDPGDGASWICQIADVFGHFGVGFVVCMSNGLVLDLLTRPMYLSTGTGRKKLSPAMRFSLALWAAAFFGSLAYGVYRINEQAVSDGPVVAVIQTNISQDNKQHGTVEQRRADWQGLLNLTRQAAGGELRPDVIVWPETVAPAALNKAARDYYKTATTGARGNERVDEVITQLTDELGIELIVGAAANYDWREVKMNAGTAREETWIIPGKRFNSAYHYRPRVDGDRTASGSGQVDKRYDKIHRVPFGEYIPWVEYSPWLKKNFLRYLSPYGDYDYTLQKGQNLTVFELPYQQAGGGETTVRAITPICFEDTVSRLVRRLMYDADGKKRADLLFNLTNDGWFANTWQRHQHLQNAVFRSIENRVPTARSVNTGVSCFIDSVGRIENGISNDGPWVDAEGVSAMRVQLDARQTVFGRLGYWPMILMMICTGVLLLMGAFVRKKR